MTDRRGFLAGAAAFLAAGPSASFAAGEKALDGSKPTQPFSAIFSNAAYGDITDQSKNTFDPATLKDKVVVFAAGYEGCPVCSKIGENLAAVHKKLQSAGVDHQIVVMSINPETDRENLGEYVESYEKQGIDKKNLTLLMAPSNAIAHNIHVEQFAPRLREREGQQPQSHTPSIFVYGKDGKNIGRIIANKAEGKEALANAVLAGVNGAQRDR